MAKFSKRHYVAVAATMRAAEPDKAEFAAHAQWCGDVIALADAFAADNARFDRGRFLAACVPPTERQT